jgi:hypothetical protein
MAPVLAPNLQNKLAAFAQAVGADIKALNGKVLTGAALLLDTEHVVGASGEPPFTNGWANFGGTEEAVSFRKDPFGKVRLKGMLLGPSGTSAFTLPVGYRPPKRLRLITALSGNVTPAALVIDSDGTIILTGSATSTWASLSGIEFDTDTVTQVLAGPQGPAGPQGSPGGNALVPMDPWHVVGTTGEPGFLNGWVNYGTYGATAAFRKFPDGRVRLRGLVRSGTVAASASGYIFVLPAGYRPQAPLLFPISANATFGEVRILPDGGVLAQVGNNSYFALDEIEFDTETVTQFAVGPQGPQGAQGPQGIPGSSVQVPMDPWHTVGANGEPPFANVGFSNIAGNQVLQFRKSPLGRVALRGYINTPAVGGSPFQLGATYRPPGTVRFEANGQNAAGTQVPVLVYVLSDGTVNVHGTNAPVAVDMSVVEFDTDTVTQFAVGPQGPKGDPGGFTGLLQDTDGINLAPYTFRSRLAFLGPNVKLTDGGAAGPLGSGDYIGISNEPTKGGGPLPNVNVRDGTAYDLVVAPDLVWRLRYTNGRWLMIGGAPLVYSQVGESSAYAGISSGQVVTVNAALSKALQWQFTPLVDVWAEVEFFMGLVAKMDAAYHYLYFSTQCAPQPPIIAFDRIAYRTQHSAVQQYENYTVRGRYGLSAGVTYTMNCVAAMSGGSWQFFQGPGQLNMNGKAWPR